MTVAPANSAVFPPAVCCARNGCSGLVC